MSGIIRPTIDRMYFATKVPNADMATVELAMCTLSNAEFSAWITACKKRPNLHPGLFSEGLVLQKTIRSRVKFNPFSPDGVSNLNDFCTNLQKALD